MLTTQVEQRVNVKFLAKLGKSATETYALLKEGYRDECLSRSQVFKWYKRFKAGRNAIADDPRPGRPSTSKTEANIEKVGQLIAQNRRLSIRAISALTGIDKETVRQILHQCFNMKKVRAKIVSQPQPTLPPPNLELGGEPTTNFHQVEASAKITDQCNQNIAT